MHPFTDLHQLKQNLQSELVKGEQILWIGRPDPTRLFSPGDAFLVPFSLVWGGFAIFWETSVFSSKAPFPMVLFGIPFVGMGLYFIFGRFIVKKLRREKTIYVVTDQRVMSISDFRGHNVQAAFINALPTLNCSTGRDGSGTIHFSSVPIGMGAYADSGLEFFSNGAASGFIGFYAIPDAAKVHELIMNIRRGEPVSPLV